MPHARPEDASVRSDSGHGFGHDESGYPKIQDYALIGDCRSAALITRRGSIEWLCWPRFDSPAIFAALLDRQRGGRWSISASDPRAAVSRRYRENTNILQTSWNCPGGIVTVTDLMPVASEQVKRTTLLADHELVRQVACTHGEVEMEVDFFPRPLYGADAARLRPAGALGIRMEVGRGVYGLRTEAARQLGDDRARARLKLRAGDTIQFSLSYGEQAPLVLPPLGEPTWRRIEEAELWWRQWAQRADY